MVLYISFLHLTSLRNDTLNPFILILLFLFRKEIKKQKKKRKEKKKRMNKESSNCPASNVPPPVHPTMYQKQTGTLLVCAPTFVTVSGNQSRYMPPRVRVVLVPKAAQTNACAATQPVCRTVSRTLSQFVTRRKS